MFFSSINFLLTKFKSAKKQNGVRLNLNLKNDPSSTIKDKGYVFIETGQKIDKKQKDRSSKIHLKFLKKFHFDAMKRISCQRKTIIHQRVAHATSFLSIISHTTTKERKIQANFKISVNYCNQI